jgi:ArsR family transcriptional regulator
MRMLKYIPVFTRLQALGDETRARLLLLLEDHELTVSELCAVVQLPQSTVSRHLKVLAEDGWVRSRAEGTSRHYRGAALDEAAAALWAVVKGEASRSPAACADAERARAVLARRKERSSAFFSGVGGGWDGLREELFGETSSLVGVVGLLEPEWVVADLGAGTGALTGWIAPFVERVVAVDDSAAMLEVLEARTAGSGNVDVRPGALEALPVEDSSLDVAFLVLALHHVVEPWTVFGEAHRVLKPGGRLIVVDMREHEREEYRAEMGHVWSGFGHAQLEAWAKRAGFDGADVRPLPPVPEARGPALFLARMRKRAARRRQR